ncbi:MAG TPA: hypothetical protein VNT01_10210 [Symbiobacteriaceae bacterium]|nr:hypothetical protein [Symbiobacteriaceae bacterium]
MAHQSIGDAEFTVKEEGALTQPLRQTLAEALQGDPLYAKLQEVRKADQVLAMEILGGLTPGMMYSTPELPKLIGAGDIPESTIRTWVDRFEDYVRPVRDGRNYKFPVISVVRVRILFLFVKQLRWNFATIRNILAGLVEDVDLMEEAGHGDAREVASLLESLVPVKGTDYRTADPRVVNLILSLVDINASTEAGRLVLSKDALPADVKAQVDKVPQLEEENARLREALATAAGEIDTVKGAAGDLQERVRVAEGLIEGQQQAWAGISLEELRAAQERRKKGLWARIFG